jgi:hypothetical protein
VLQNAKVHHCKKIKPVHTDLEPISNFLTAIIIFIFVSIRMVSYGAYAPMTPE